MRHITWLSSYMGISAKVVLYRLDGMEVDTPSTALTIGAPEALKSIFPICDPNHSRIKASFTGEYLAIKVVLHTTNIGI